MKANTVIPLVICFACCGLVIFGTSMAVFFSRDTAPLVFAAFVAMVVSGGRACFAAFEDGDRNP